MIDSGIFVLPLQVIATVAGSWLIATVLAKLITRGLKRAHAPPGLARPIRDALTILWIVFAAVGVLTVTGLASEFSFLTISGIVGLATSLAPAKHIVKHD